MQPNPNQNRKPSRFVRFSLIALAILMLPIVVLATTVAATGMIAVEVHEPSEGLDLYVPVPALLVDLAVMAAPHIIPDDELADVRREIAPYRDAISTFADELEDCPDAVLVQVESANENVQISKRGGSFHIAVDSPDGDVNVKVPARLLSRVLDIL